MTETVLIDGQPHEMEARPVTLILHKDVMNVEVPDRFEINPENTLEEIKNLSQAGWTHISTGEIFQHLFRIVFPLPDGANHTAPSREITIPAQLEDLQKMEMGIRHIAGLIILAMTKGGIEHKDLFFKLPESYLHPAFACNLGDLFIILPKIIEYMQSLGEAPPKPPTPMQGWLGK